MRFICYCLFVIEFDSFIAQWYTGIMDDRRRTLAAITILVGFFVLVALVVGVLFSGKKILSPVPDESAIKIIFVTPTAVPAAK